MNIPLDRGPNRAGKVSLARQIQLHLERLISQGLLQPGVKLPATRELARDLAVNRTTVALAYEELVAGGWARAHVGQGTFVAERKPADAEAAAPAAVPRFDWSGVLSKGAQVLAADRRRRAGLGQMPRSAPGLISFAGGMPDSGLFPTEAFRRVLNRVLREEGRELLQYYPARGYPPLRQYLAGYLLRFGLEAHPDEILIVNGSQQGFDLVARTLLDPGDFVALEEPSYPRAIQVFRAMGAQLLPVPMAADGLDVDYLERLLERQSPKLLYCQPTAHNPTGLTMTAAARQRLLQMAARHRLPIVEDGFDGSLYYRDRPPVPLRGLDASGLVIYIGTFSKILFPGLRLGWIVAAPELIERLETAKELADIHTSPLLQAAVYHFCRQRLLDRHQGRVLREYARRRSVLLGALGRRMPAGVAWTETQGGFSLLLTLPEGMDAAALLPRAIERGVAYTPGNAFFVDGGGERTLRLSFSSVPLGQVEEGVKRLGEVIREAQRHSERALRAPQPSVPLV
ncbi:MAG TPA: PLP-dependent aminotransferase family protein [Methylomirabilota bacterium]|nr:PLP-dependent aminotransferase family protein [Methylomirabilota bacterium]